MSANRKSASVVRAPQRHWLLADKCASVVVAVRERARRDRMELGDRVLVRKMPLESAHPRLESTVTFRPWRPMK